VAGPEPSSRRFPLLAVTRGQVVELLVPLVGARAIGAIQYLEEGLTNTILRVSVHGSTPDLLVRIYAGGNAPWEKERRLLERLTPDLPVPRVLLCNDGRGAVPYPSLVYEWIEGVTLNAMRRQASSEELLSLANPLGRIIGKICTMAPMAWDTFQGQGETPPSLPEVLLSVTQERLLRGRARVRLGEGAADALCRHLSRQAEGFSALGSAKCLVHGDLGGRNILVVSDGGGRWRISGIVDWESAFTGWAMWDVGSLFRYRRRYGPDFLDQFERGYRNSGGTLPEDWWKLARLLDATRQVATLDDERELPSVFADCRELLESILQDDV
jgi:aminoglycoside phosphotransferase (APT) family kinase protein